MATFCVTCLTLLRDEQFRNISYLECPRRAAPYLPCDLCEEFGGLCIEIPPEHSDQVKRALQKAEYRQRKKALTIIGKILRNEHQEALAEFAPAEGSPDVDSPAKDSPAETSEAENSPAEESLAENSLGEEFLSEENLGEEFLSEESLAENSLAEENLAENSLGEEFLSEENLAEEFLSEESLAENSLAENSLAENSLAENSLAEENLAEESLSEGSLAETPLADTAPAENSPDETESRPDEGGPINDWLPQAHMTYSLPNVMNSYMSPFTPYRRERFSGTSRRFTPYRLPAINRASHLPREHRTLGSPMEPLNTPMGHDGNPTAEYPILETITIPVHTSLFQYCPWLQQLNPWTHQG